jgi:precorrin isomerase
VVHEGEGRDRTNQSSLIEEVAATAAAAAAAATASEQHKPVILVAMGGGPVDLNTAKSNENISAIAGVATRGWKGGAVIADDIFGVTNAWGRLTQTW